MNAPVKTNTYQQHSNDIIPDLSSKLKRFKRLSEGRFSFSCLFHEDKTPSACATIKPDGLVLMHCFSCGASGLDFCNALGINPSALFPPTDNPRYEKQNRYGFSAWQLLHALQLDLVRLLIIVNELKANETLSPDDRDFVSGVVLRLNDGIQFLEGRKQ